jgi:hypothetical protein
MTKIRSEDSSRIYDERDTTIAKQQRADAASKSRNKINNPGMFPKATPPKKAARSYTPSPTVAGSRGRASGGVWRDKTGAVTGTSKGESAPISRIKPKANRSGGGGRKR